MTYQLFLVRHGEVANPNHIVYGDLPGFHLSPNGVQQVHATARHLSNAHIDCILSSPLIRAIETATAIASRHGLDPRCDNNLTESGQFPHWINNRWESIPDLFPGELEAYLEDAEAAGGQESLGEVAGRYVAVIERSVKDGCAGIVIVGHQDPIQATRLVLTGRRLAELRNDPPEHGEVIRLTSTDGSSWVESDRWTPGSQDK